MSPSAAFGGISASESQTTQGLVSDHLPTHTTSTTTTTTMDRRQQMPFRHPLSSRHVFFLLYLFIHQLTSTQQRETTTSPKKLKRRVYMRRLGFRYGFLLFIQLFVTNINSTKGHDEQAQEKPKRRV